MTSRVRFPLYLRILGWLLLNLAVAAGVLWLVIRSEFSAETLMTGNAGLRVQQFASVVRSEMVGRSPAEQDAALERLGADYGLRLGVFARDALQVAGPSIMDPPMEVLEKMLRPPGRRPGGGDGPPRQPPFPRDENPGRDREPGDEGRGGEPPRGPGPNQLIHTRDPDRYWIVAPLQPIPDFPRGANPVRLLIESPTLSAGGLLFDAGPWLRAGGMVLVLSALWWLPFVHGITRSVSVMTGATERIAEGHFDTPIAVRRKDELGQLATAIGAMAQRLDGFVSGQKRFLGDIAHELCAPIARVQLALGILEHRATGLPANSLEDLREEIQQMSTLVDELLSFSKTSLRARAVNLTAVDVSTLAQRIAARESPMPEHVTVDLPAELYAEADPELLGRAVSNLVRNALRYAGDAGPITIIGEAREARVHLIVADRGPGVPEAALQQIFDPFFRLDPARTRETGGVGLGLAIVQTCVQSCGGHVSAANREGGGLAVTIALKKAGKPTPAGSPATPDSGGRPGVYTSFTK